MVKKILIVIAVIGALVMLAIVAFGSRSAGISSPTADPCIQTCNDQYRICVDAEQARHEAVLRACNKDQACQNAERELHRAIMDDCRNELRQCKANCP